MLTVGVLLSMELKSVAVLLLLFAVVDFPSIIRIRRQLKKECSGIGLAVSGRVSNDKIGRATYARLSLVYWYRYREGQCCVAFGKFQTLSVFQTQK